MNTNENINTSAPASLWPGFDLVTADMFRGAKVLEIGCGRGGRAMEIAAAGADHVVGIDIRKESIADAHEALASRPEAIKSAVEFRLTELKDVADNDFDIIMSENALEHILDIDQLLAQVSDRLKPGGRVLIGFGPLYHSPFGDHTWLRRTLPFYDKFPWPWGHLLFREHALKKLSAQHGREITDTVDWPYLVLNGLTVDDYLTLFNECPLEVDSIEYNPSRSPIARLASAMRHLPGARKYLTWVMNVVLIKPKAV